MPRAKPKVRVGLDVLASVIPEGGFPLLGKTTNVSSTGMLVEVRTPLEVGSRVKVKLFVPGSTNQVEITGEVIREAAVTDTGHTYGVQFVELSQDSEFELQRFLAIRLDKTGPSR